MIYSLNLPELPTSIIRRLNNLAQANINDEDVWHHWRTNRPFAWGPELQEKYNIVERIGAFVDGDLLADIKVLLEPYIPFEVKYTLFIMKNVRPGRPAVFPAHTDWKRKVALNYTLRTARLARTNFHDGEVEDGPKFYDLDLPITESYIVAANTWYTFDTTKIHSVTEIQGTRVLFLVEPVDQSITFEYAMTRINKPGD